ncbi:hypothetical protein TNCV_4040261 [Trichonephila clavipes]|nr:hypothetical protein TNCV_4040261 [Trichonephila clavipes]
MNKILNDMLEQKRSIRDTGVARSEWALYQNSFGPYFCTTDFVIFNLGQVTMVRPNLALHFPNFHTIPLLELCVSTDLMCIRPSTPLIFSGTRTRALDSKETTLVTAV